MNKLQIISELFGHDFCPYVKVWGDIELYLAKPRESAVIPSSILQDIINKAKEHNARITYTSYSGFLVTFN